MLQVKLIIGSTREGRAADLVAPWLIRGLKTRDDFELQVLDLRDWDLPMFQETFATIGDMHNPTVLKNAIDSVFVTFGFRNKPSACVAYSGGLTGGSRAPEHLAQIALEAEMVPLRNNVLLPFIGEVFDETGEPKNLITNLALSILLDDLSWWGEALKSARTSGALPPAYLDSAFRGALKMG
jgi:NAD(P)H-dependent FMN reductase